MAVGQYGVGPVVSGGGGGLANPATLASGSILQGNPANTIAELAIGSESQILVAQSSGLLAYEDYINASKRVVFYDDFITGGNGTSFGSPHWQQSGGSGGAVGATYNTAYGFGVTNPGCFYLYSGTSVNAHAQLYGDNSCGVNFIGGGAATWETLVRNLDVSTAGNTYIIKMGWMNRATPSAAVVSGIYFSYTTGTNWILNCTNASTTTTSDTGIAAAAATWYKLRFDVNAAGTSVQAYVNGVAAGAPIVTNIPVNTVGMTQVYQMYSTAWASGFRLMLVDYVKFVQTLTVAR